MADMTLTERLENLSDLLQEGRKKPWAVWMNDEEYEEFMTRAEAKAFKEKLERNSDSLNARLYGPFFRFSIRKNR